MKTSKCKTYIATPKEIKMEVNQIILTGGHKQNA